MPTVKSLVELDLIQEGMLRKKQTLPASGRVQVIVTLGSCGIAVGAIDTMQSILHYIEAESIQDISVTQTGCTGLCECEPIVQVTIGDQPKVMYGKVNARVAEMIMKQHVQNGQPVKEYIIRI